MNGNNKDIKTKKEIGKRMKKNPESKQVTDGGNWQFLFELAQREKNKSFILRIYHNPEINQIKQVGGQKDKIISCPMELDFITCSYLVNGDSNVFIKGKLLRVLNTMFTNGCNKCPYLIEWHQMQDNMRDYYISKRIIQECSFFPAKITDAHYYLYKSYAAEDW
jgi:hypothetical protein